MKICVDPGHGGPDPGSIGFTGLREADVTLRAGLILRSMLVARGHTVLMTRSTAQAISTNKATDLMLRAAKANSAKCNLFVSLHCNSFADVNAGGTETWYYTGSSKGLSYAKRAQEAMIAAGGLTNRGVKNSSSLAVLRQTTMPALLLELAFISNPKEEKLLRDDAWLNRMLSAVKEALLGNQPSDQ